VDVQKEERSDVIFIETTRVAQSCGPTTSLMAQMRAMNISKSACASKNPEKTQRWPPRSSVRSSLNPQSVTYALPSTHLEKERKMTS